MFETSRNSVLKPLQLFHSVKRKVEGEALDVNLSVVKVVLLLQHRDIVLEEWVFMFWRVNALEKILKLGLVFH